ncbi:HBL313Cp [Eremothecium sinecaudum]|uniref:HBL313Cp n=1 Tax=Eremothecium sinecaudum TaxID=45286 RepID=A0A120K0Q7_9SACH|nr:HBL313Cp [Eremothecium sinecaudum]AMD18589.1 HBL313Cp [Eremothecium sinecaudum]
MSKVISTSALKKVSFIEPPIIVDSISSLNSSKSANKLFGRLSSARLINRIRIEPLIEKSDTDFNSPRSLPTTLFPRKSISEEVSNDPKTAAWLKPVKIWWKIGKFLLHNYRAGFTNTYRVFRDTRTLPTDLETQLFRKIEYHEIESRLNTTALPLDIGISRRQLQEWKRRNMIWKLPTFGLLVLLLEELAIVFIHFWPNFSPWNCLIPSVYKKVSDRRAERLKVSSSITGEDLNYKSVFAIPHKEALQYAARMGLVPVWKSLIYTWSGNTKFSAEILRKWHQYLFVDNWFILRELFSAENRDVVINDRELVNMILERQLFTKGEDLNAMVQSNDGQLVMLMRLIIYLSWQFNNTVTVGGPKLYNEKWGVNNVGIMNFPGSTRLVNIQEAGNIQQIEKY